MISTDEKNWSKGTQFRPERFLENGKFKTARSKAFLTFGVGRRICAGENFAIADLFLVLVRILQMTAHYDLVLGTNGGLEIDPKYADLLTPYEYKIKFIPKSI